MDINPSILREYDVRGITEAEHTPSQVAEYEKWYGQFPGVTLSRELAGHIGRAYGSVIRQNGGSKIIIGHEIRPFSQEIKDAFIEGALATGLSVIDAGVSLTPILYFANAYYGLDGAVSVTGSHNVYFFNGFKMMKRDNYPIYGQELQGWQQLIGQEKYFKSDHLGKLESRDIYPDYQAYFTKHFRLNRQLRVVIDSGNGTPGLFAPKLFHALGCQVTELYSTPDATFPNHLPDPEDSYMLQDLADKVGELGADLGIAFDADGDRFGSVDGSGAYIPADHLIALFARHYLKDNPGNHILYDVKCSRNLDTIITNSGGIPLMHRTGHAPIKQTMRENKNIVLGGEVSGHLYFTKDYFRIDDGLFAAAKALELLADQPNSYAELFDFIPSSIATPEIKLPCEDSTKHLVVQALIDQFASKYPTNTIDGARISFTKTSWGLVRASNTAPYLTVRLEADTFTELLRIKNILADTLEAHGSIHDKLDRTNVVSRTGKLGWV